MRPLLVRDLMTENVFTLNAEDDLTTLYDLMDAEHIRHIPVIDQEKELVGLVTHRDLLRSALSGKNDLPLSLQREMLRRDKVGHIMMQEVESVEPDTPIGDAALTMLENKYGCLPVVEGMRLVGILTEADFVRCLAGMIPGVSLEDLGKEVKKSKAPGHGSRGGGKGRRPRTPGLAEPPARSNIPAPVTAR